jgi:hypothetical protein
MGLIGFFDMLGYGNMLRNNRIDNLIKVLESIKRVPKDVPAIALRWMGGSDSKIVQTILETIKPLIISDSILLTMPLVDGGDVRFQRLRPFVFLVTAYCLLRKTFDLCLPLRGAIGFGEYYVEDSPPVFLGTVIAEIHELEKCQEWCGCVISPEAQKLFAERVWSCEGDPLFLHLLTNYPIPFKPDRKMAASYALNWAFPIFPDTEALEGDIREAITRSFSGYGKADTDSDTVVRSIGAKIENTEAFLLHCKKERERWLPILGRGGTMLFSIRS